MTIHANVVRCEVSPSDARFVLFAFASGDAQDFAEAIAAVKALPYQQRRWIPNSRCWRVRAGALVGLSYHWPNLRLELARIGLAGDYSRQQCHDSTPPPSMAASRSVAEAYRVLCLTPDAPVGLIEATRRYWSKELHPDRAGGDLERMKAVNVAADRCLDFARQHLSAA